MIAKPSFKPHLLPFVIPGEGVLLLSEMRPRVLEGRLFEIIAPWLDGRSTTDEIIGQVEAQISPAEVYYALTLLEQKGLIAEADETFTIDEAAFWTLRDVELKTAARRLRQTTVAVSVFGDFDAEPFLSLLQSLHLRTADTGDLGVVLTDDYLRGELAAYNQEALGLGRPWLLFRPVGREIWLGPIFEPRATGCWACLAHRLRLNRAADLFVENLAGRDVLPQIVRGATSATRQMALAMAASKVAEWVARGAPSDLAGRVVSFEPLSWQSLSHTLVRQPYCPACSELPSGFTEPPKQVSLMNRRKTAQRDGGHRAVSPEETLKTYHHLISPITGVVSGLTRRGASPDDVMHVYIAGDNRAIRHDSLQSLQTGLRAKSSGKGTTDAQARTGALCEAIERYAGYFQGSEPRRKGRLAEMDSLAIHPNECMLFSERQYRERAVRNAAKSRFNFIPAPFDEEAEVEWTPVWSLTQQRFRYLPTALCYYSYPMPPDNPYCQACSNGSAAGNTIEEAILQGLLELVERDCVALWWYNRVRRPAVDLDSFDEPFLDRERTFLQANDRDLWALDLTNDLQVPAFGAFSQRIGREQSCIMMGFGAHLDPRTAILRAVTELNQMLSWTLPHERGDALHERIRDTETLRWIKTATLANQSYLLPDEKTPPSRVRDFKRLATDDLKDDVLVCQALIERHGLELLALDQTRPDIGLPVVKVIVPGLRRFHARFAPGRLYEAPVRLGWLPAPLSEEQLNPTNMFL